MVAYSDKLHDAVARVIESERVIDKMSDFQDSPEEAAWHDLIEEISEAGYRATTAAGAFAALRWLQTDMRENAGGRFHIALMNGAMAYFDHLESAMGNGKAMNEAFLMMDGLSGASAISGAGFAAVYDALTASIDTIGGIISQPRCSSDRALSPAGEYLDAITLYLMSERSRVMRIAEDSPIPDRSDGSWAHLHAVLKHKVEDGDFTIEQTSNLISMLQAVEKADG